MNISSILVKLCTPLLDKCSSHDFALRLKLHQLEISYGQAPLLWLLNYTVTVESLSVCNVCLVLADPHKKAIYDTTGIKGLETDGWEVSNVLF